MLELPQVQQITAFLDSLKEHRKMAINKTYRQKQIGTADHELNYERYGLKASELLNTITLKNKSVKNVRN